MEPSRLRGGQLAAKPTEDDASVDRLSALPDDVLLRILVRLEDAAAAGRTSVLARRWRRLWARLPELRFPSSPEPRAIASALAAHEAAISCLDVGTEDAAPESVAAWLPAAARRLSGSLVFTNRVPGKNANEDGEKRGAFELPCLKNATRVSLDLGCLSVAVPRAGVFARLIELSLSHVQLRGPCALGDAVSSRRCPCLQKLTVSDTLGLNNLTIRSDSLRHLDLEHVRALQQLTIVVPALEHLKVLACFYRNRNRPVADISARQLKVLKWGDSFDRSSCKLGRMKHLQSVCPGFLAVYGPSPNNPSILALLRCFKVIQELALTLYYQPDIIDNQSYVLEDMKMLPGITFLHLSVVSNGHAFGAGLFHVLRLCSGTRKLALNFSRDGLEEQTACPPGCICNEQQNWKTDKLLLNHLQEVEITKLRGSEYEVTFVKQLFNWAKVVRKMTVTFDSSITESLAEESCQILRSFSRPEICLEFYMYRDMIKVLYAPEN